MKARGQQFQGGFAAGDDVAGEINFAHPARADSLDELIVTDGLTGERIRSAPYSKILVASSTTGSWMKSPDRCREASRVLDLTSAVTRHLRRPSRETRSSCPGPQSSAE